MERYICEQYAGTHRALDVVLGRATKAQRVALLGWIEDTRTSILEEQKATAKPREDNGIQPLRWYFWGRLCEKWGKIGRKHPVQNELEDLEGGVQ